MGGLAGIVRFDGVPVSTHVIERMMALIRHRGPLGVFSSVRGGCGLGQAAFALREKPIGETGPVWHPNGRWGITADARLYNRSDLIDELGMVQWITGGSSDSAILLAAYEKWGASLLDKVDGDYAFAIYDQQERTLFAARDPFGIKPLFYASAPAAFLFASEPKQLLRGSEISQKLHDMIIGEFLFGSFQDNRRTFFANVSRLRPAHYLIATTEGVREVRYWNPAPSDLVARSTRDVLEEFRHLFKNAVEKRLNTDWPVVAQLSGGFDSSSIVAMAGEIYRECSDLPNFSTVSSVYGDLECDESRYIDAVSATVPFEAVRFNPLDGDGLAGLKAEFWQLDSPFTDIQRAGFNTTAEYINNRQGKLLLTGLGGDELVHEEYYLRDLARQGRHLRLLKEAWKASRKSWNSFAWLYMDALRALAPEPIKRLYRSFRKDRWKPPAWANPDFVQYFKSCPEPPPPPAPGFKTATQNAVIQFMNYPSVTWALEALEVKSAYRGFEMAHPFMDRGLVEFVARIPMDLRMPDGQWKFLLYEGLSDLLPKEVRNRLRKTRFSSFNQALFKQRGTQWAELVFDGSQWESSGYVDPKQIQKTFENSGAVNDSNGQTADRLWRVVNNELWLRQLKQNGSIA